MINTMTVAAELRRRLAVAPGDCQLWADYLESELQDAYKLLANIEATQDATQQIRGRITFINKLIGYVKRPASPSGTL